MGTVRNLWTSLIEFRPDPTRPRDDRVPIGVAMGFATAKGVFLVLWARKEFSPNETRSMDAIHRRLLLERRDYLSKEFEKAMRSGLNPHDVLDTFARSKRASIYVSPPERLMASKSSLTSTRTVIRRVFEEIVAAALAGARPEDLHSRRKFAGRTTLPSDLPDPWAISRKLNGTVWDRAA